MRAPHFSFKLSGIPNSAIPMVFWSRKRVWELRVYGSLRAPGWGTKDAPSSSPRRAVGSLCESFPNAVESRGGGQGRLAVQDGPGPKEWGAREERGAPHEPSALSGKKGEI